jgi:hypothetical protein
VTKTKTKATTTAFVLMLTIAAFMACLPMVKAATIPTWSFISVAPNPIGVGQRAVIEMWLDVMPPYDWSTDKPIVPWAYTITVTKPDGTTQTLGPFYSDAVGGTWTDFTPTTAGNYSFSCSYAGATVLGNTYSPSSTQTTLIVQEEPIPTWPAAPLPTDYWARPIEAENREWSQIAGNWLGLPVLWATGWNASGAFSPYTTAPNSAHIVWTKEVAFGGIVGENFGSTSYYPGLSYESKWGSPVIINGRLYYNQRKGSSEMEGIACLDLTTGEQLWLKEGATLSCGQLLDFDSPNQHGVIPYLWDMSGATWTMYDPFSGDLICAIPGAQGTFFQKLTFDAKGNMLFYYLDGVANQLVLWNSTLCIGKAKPAPGGGFGVGDPNYWRPLSSSTYNWSDGIMWNKTVPDVPGVQQLTSIGDGVLVAASQADTGIIGVTAYSTDTGAQLWNMNLTSTEPPTFFLTQIKDGILCWFRQETKQWYGFNAKTGSLVWGPTDPYESAWGIYSSSQSGTGSTSPVMAYGKLYASSYDGMLHCFDLATGKHLWDYWTGSSGFETPYGTWPLAGGVITVADGKVYVTVGEHSPTQPLFRGARIHAVDAETGKGIWNILGWMETPIVADGYLAVMNAYDNRIYCFGKGKTAVTVSAPDVATTMGTPIVIKGTVTDQTPGPAAGIAAVSDESMTQWMEYLYMQKPMPTNATGVPVTLDVIDANGNYRNIGTTTSDMNGFYTFTWKPDIPGDFKVIATFPGSESYYASYSETAFTVTEAPPATPTPTPLALPPTETYFAVSTIAIIVAIAIVGILLLRKH